MVNDVQIDQIADAVHEIWMHWSQKAYNRMNSGWTKEQFYENWAEHWKAFSQLDEHGKDIERKWAHVLIDVMKKNGTIPV